MKIDNIVGKEIAINCKTEKEAIKICQFLKGKGLKWNNGESLDKTYWKERRESMCYRLIFRVGTIRVKYGSKDEFNTSGGCYKIISCDEFLKSNMSILNIEHRYIK